MTAAISATGSDKPHGAHDVTPIFNGLRISQSWIFRLLWIIICPFCGSLFVLLFLFFWSLFRVSFFDYSFGISSKCCV